MDTNKKINVELNIAIGLGIVLVLVLIIIFAKKAMMPSEIEKKEEIKKVEDPSKKSPYPSMIDELDVGTALQKEQVTTPPQEKEPHEEILTLKEIPIDSAVEKHAIEEDYTEEDLASEDEETGEAKDRFQTQPSPEDMKILQKQNLIIY